MRWYKNLKMRNKLFLAFGFLVICAVIMGAIGFTGIKKINSEYEASNTVTNRNVQLSSDLLYSFMLQRLDSKAYIVNVGNNTQIEQNKTSLKQSSALIGGYLDELEEISRVNAELSSFSSEDLQKLRANLEDYEKITDEVYTAARDGIYIKSKQILETDGEACADIIIGMLQDGYNNAIALSDSAIISNKAIADMRMLQLAVALLFIIVIAVAMSFYVAGVVVKPIKQLIASSHKVSEGDLKAAIALNSKDEIGQLSRSFEQVVEVFGTFDADLEVLFYEFQENGNIEARLDEAQYNGDYQQITKRINGIINDLTQDTVNLLGILKNYGNGDFEATLPRFPGKKALMNDVLDELQANLKSINSDVKALLGSAQNGELEVRIDYKKYHGDWQRLTAGMNELLDGVIEPIKETIAVVSEMANGNLKVSIKGDYKGEYLEMKQAVNTTLAALSKYIDEISSVLDAMSHENFDLEITNDYIGDFAPIKQSLLRIISTFNDILGNINISADQVSQGAKQISQSSMALAQGASEQAGAIDKLTVALNEITKQTSGNAENAIKANQLAEISKENAADGSKEMSAMLSSMGEIETASKNISKIIKVIEDIAFQTNLLALNAAIEAARAGQHGKGFAVVADQVRSLAGRSKDAAQETTMLIEGTVAKVAQGMALANKTSNVLGTIVSQIDNISEIVGGVASSSNEQAGAISEINDSIGKISFVTQANTATSEEAAASSQELLSQSDILKDKVSRFKLKNIKIETKSASATKERSATVPLAKPATVTKAQPSAVPLSKPATVTKAQPAAVPLAKPATVTKAQPAAVPPAKPATVTKAQPATVPTAKPATVVSKPAVTTASKPATAAQTVGLKPSLPQKAIAKPSPPKEEAPPIDGLFVSPKKQASGAAPIKSAGKTANEVFESKDFGKYS